MAEAVRYVCSACRRAIEAWSDGNPYYIDETGRKQYAYHPDHERLARCIGYDSPPSLRRGVQCRFAGTNGGVSKVYDG